MKRERDELMISYRNLMERFCEMESKFLYERYGTQPETSNDPVKLLSNFFRLR